MVSCASLTDGRLGWRRGDWVIPVLALLFVLAVPSVASGWYLDVSDGMGYVVRESGDSTAAVKTVIYYQYASGETSPTSSKPLDATSSYGIGSNQISGSGTTAARIPFSGFGNGGRVQMVEVNLASGGATQCRLPFAMYSVRPSVPVTAGVVPVVGDVGGGSSGATLSLPSTLTVDPWGSAGMGDGWLAAVVGAVLVTCGAVVAYVLRRVPWSPES